MPMPAQATVAATGVKTPRDFDRTTFRKTCVEAHTFCQVEVLLGAGLSAQEEFDGLKARLLQGY